MTKVYRSISESIRKNLTHQELWQAEDKGLICNWEVGREIAIKQPEIKKAVMRMELPILGWKGGTDKKLKDNNKFGSLQYLAQLQGIKGVDLDIDTEAEVTLKCAKFGTEITYTSNLKLLHGTDQ